MKQNLIGNITLQTETNYSVHSENVDIWPGEFPYTPGNKFPSDKLRDRANISMTNRMLFNNDYNSIFSFLWTIPEIDPVLGMQVREVISNLPYFKTITDAFVGLCCSPMPIIDTPDKDDQEVSSLLYSSNFEAVIQSIFKSLMIDCIDAYKIGTDIMGKPIIQQIAPKNMEVFVSAEDLTTIYCVNVSNVLNDKVEFISYFYDGRIEKRVFNYSNGILGSMVGEVEKSNAYNGKYAESPIVVIKHNTESINDVYGVDQFRYWDAGIVSLCRSLSNLLKLNERCRELIRKVPASAITRTDSGATLYLNRGVISYPDGADTIPDVEYVVPQLKENIEACLETIDKTTKLLATSSALSPVWFDFEKLGSNLSAKSIKAAMIPTSMRASLMCVNMSPYIQEIVRKVALIGGVELDKRDIDITWEPGVNMDEAELLEVIDSRLANNTISLEDAIKRLDRVPRSVAKERATRLMGQTPKSKGQNSDDLPAGINNDFQFTSGDSEIDVPKPPNNTENIRFDNEIVPYSVVNRDQYQI